MTRTSDYGVGELFFGTLAVLWLVFGVNPLELLVGLTAIRG